MKPTKGDFALCCYCKMDHEECCRGTDCKTINKLLAETRAEAVKPFTDMDYDLTSCRRWKEGDGFCCACAERIMEKIKHFLTGEGK